MQYCFNKDTLLLCHKGELFRYSFGRFQIERTNVLIFYKTLAYTNVLML